MIKSFALIALAAAGLAYVDTSLSKDSWINEALAIVVEIPFNTELKILKAYTSLRQHPQVAVVGFYVLVVILVFKLSRLFKRTPPLHFRVIQETWSSDLLSTFKTELEALKRELRRAESPSPAVKVKGTPEYVTQLGREVHQLIQSQSEFQIHLIEFHKDLWHVLWNLQEDAGNFDVSPILAADSNTRLDSDISPTFKLRKCLKGDFMLDQVSHNATFGSGSSQLL